MPDKRSSIPRGAALLAVAAVAGVTAGAIAVYFKGADDGNGAPSTVAAADTDCSDALHVAQTIDPLATGELAAFRVVTEADNLAEIAFEMPDGSATTLGGLGEKLMLVNLWATWCGPCREEMPALDRLEAELGGDEFEVVAINVDLQSPERARAFLDEIKIENLAFYSDPSVGVFNDLKRRGLALGLPLTMLVDGHGCRIGSVQGPAVWDSDDAKTLIKAALQA